MNEDLIQQIQALLKSQRHFDQAVLSLWINHYNELSDAEKQSVELHLETCRPCKQLFENVIDEELELDPEKDVIELPYLSGHHHNGQHVRIFENASRTITLTVTSTEKAQLVVTKIPAELEGQKARIDLGGNSFRIPSLQQGHAIGLGYIGMEAISSITLTSIPRAVTTENQSLPRILSPIARYLAAAVVLIALTGTVLYFNRNKPTVTVETTDRRDSLVTADTAKQITPMPEEIIEPKQPLLADNFTPNAVLEAHIQRTYRSDLQLEKITPANAETLAVPIQFNWTPPDADQALIVTMVDHHNRKIWEQPADTLPLRFSKKLTPGLYYWMIKTDGEIVSVRKFFVK